MNNTFLIPANTKKSMLKFGLFNDLDLIIAIAGVALTFLLMIFLPVNIFWVALIALSPGVTAAFLVFPIPNYHNVRTVINNAWIFYTTRQRYIWKGWCASDGERDKK